MTWDHMIWYSVLISLASATCCMQQQQQQQQQQRTSCLPWEVCRGCRGLGSTRVCLSSYLGHKARRCMCFLHAACCLAEVKCMLDMITVHHPTSELTKRRLRSGSVYGQPQSGNQAALHAHRIHTGPSQ